MQLSNGASTLAPWHPGQLGLGAPPGGHVGVGEVATLAEKTKGVNIMLKVNGKTIVGRAVLFCREPVVGFFCADGFHTDIRTEETSECDCVEKGRVGLCLFIDRGPGYTATIQDDGGELNEG